MSLPVTAEPLPTSYAFGKVVGRVIHLIADTAEDTDDKPQARAGAGKVTFAPKEVLRKTTDADYPAIVLHAPESANLSGSGRILDAEGRQGIWLAVGIYTVTFEITGAPRAIPSFDIEVTTAHTDAAPLDLASVVPYVPPSGAVVQTVLIPSGGTTGQVLVRTADGGLAWADQTGGTGGGAVDSVNGQTGVVVLDAADVGAAPAGDYATSTELSDGLATKVNSSTYTAGLATKADVEHVHEITDLTATGTPDATTYLRGDGTWATPAGGSGDGTVTAADITDSTAVGRSVLTAADAATARTAIEALGATDAVELDAVTAGTLTQNGVATGNAADSGHTHRLPDADGSGDITLYTASGSPIKLHTVGGVVGADGGGGGGTGGTGKSDVAASGRLYLPPFFGGTGLGASTVTAGQSFGIPIYLPDGTVTRLVLGQPGGTATPGDARLGIFTLDEANLANSALLVDGGAASLGNPNGTPAVTVSQAVTAGWYLLAVFATADHSMAVVNNAVGYATRTYVFGGGTAPGYAWLGASGLTTAFGATFGGTGALPAPNVVPQVYVEMAL